MKKRDIFFIIFLMLPLRVFGAFTIPGTPEVQRAPLASSSTSNVIAVVGIIVAVFLIYWFVFKKKK